ncbi:hypothetical protein D9M70_550180 [compost metagenome]
MACQAHFDVVKRPGLALLADDQPVIDSTSEDFINSLGNRERSFAGADDEDLLVRFDCIGLIGNRQHMPVEAQILVRSLVRASSIQCLLGDIQQERAQRDIALLQQLFLVLKVAHLGASPSADPGLISVETQRLDSPWSGASRHRLA